MNVIDGGLVTRERIPIRRRRWARRTLAATTVLLLVAGVVGAVATSESETKNVPAAQARDEATDLNLISHSVDLAEERGSARMSVEFAIENLEGLPPELDGSFSGEGVMSLADGTSQFTMGLPVPGAEPVEMEMRVVGTQMYMRSPLFTEGTGFETEWLGLDMSELTGLNESELLGSGMADADLGSELQYLRGASEQIENLGREEVRGVPTTHYWVLIDERRALEEIPEHGREAFEKMLDAYEEEFGTTEYPMDVWIDDDGLPRRIVTVESLASDPTLPPGTTLTATMEFHDFGVPVDVQEPPEGDVLDLTDMLRQGFGLD